MVWQIDILSFFLWAWFYFFCLPITMMMVAFVVLTCGVSNSAVVAHLSKIPKLTTTPSSSPEERIERMDEIMDILTDINTSVMPTNSKHLSWGTVSLLLQG